MQSVEWLSRGGAKPSTARRVAEGFDSRANPPLLLPVGISQEGNNGASVGMTDQFVADRETAPRLLPARPPADRVVVQVAIGWKHPFTNDNSFDSRGAVRLPRTGHNSSTLSAGTNAAHARCVLDLPSPAEFIASGRFAFLRPSRMAAVAHFHRRSPACFPR
jgi:hypothetical protein